MTYNFYRQREKILKMLKRQGSINIALKGKKRILHPDYLLVLASKEYCRGIM